MVISLRSLLFSGLTRRGFQTQTNVEPQQGILKQGVTLLSTNTDSETVLGWRKMASEIAQELKEQAGTLEVGQHKGFKEVFQSAEGSYHFSLSSPSPHDHNSARSLMEEYSFAKHTQTRENRTENLQSQLKTELLNHIEKHAHKLFCSVLSPSYQQRGQGLFLLLLLLLLLSFFLSCYPLTSFLLSSFPPYFKELLVAYPSSPAQKWHTNASPLFGAQELEGNLLPPYDLTVFIPLDTPDPTLGFTEFACGSQVFFLSYALLLLFFSFIFHLFFFSFLLDPSNMIF